jgi:hypothetical protein
MAKTTKRKKRKNKDSIERSIQQITNRAESRKQAGRDEFQAHWQASLEVLLLMAEDHLKEHQGQLEFMRISNREEWGFYVDVMEKLDLPPDTCALLITPSAFKGMPLPTLGEWEDSGLMAWQRDSCWVLISRCDNWKVIMQASLPGLESVGIDIFDDGAHIADYSYNNIDECLEDLSRIVWIYFKPNKNWTEEMITRYTENYFAKTLYIFGIEDVPVHPEYSYLHNPKLLKLSPLESAFKVLRTTIPKRFESLDEWIEFANDLNKDWELGDPTITKMGILNDNKAQCQALLGQITFEIDQLLDILDSVEGVDLSFRRADNPEYDRAFDEAARAIYESITSRVCPESVRVE